MIICFHSLDQFFFCKIRPGNRGKIKLRICQLPQQEIGNPLFIAGSDQQIRIRNSSSIQVSFQSICRDPCRIHFSTLYFCGQFFHCTDDLIPASVINGNLEMQAIVVLCGLFQFRDPRPDILIQSGLVTQDSDTHTILLRCLQTGLHIIAEQLHQRVHFILRAVPVLCRKSIYCQILDSHTVRLFTDHFHRLGSLHMPVIAGHSFCFGPTAVAVQIIAT